jgi:plastocyanin
MTFMRSINRALGRRGAVAALMAAAWFAAAAPGSALAEAPNTIRLNIKSFMFAPMTLNVKAGSTVTWTNEDQEPHTVVSETGLFKSGALDTADSFSFKFDTPGTYHYLCTIHPRMTGTVVAE